MDLGEAGQLGLAGQGLAEGGFDFGADRGAVEVVDLLDQRVVKDLGDVGGLLDPVRTAPRRRGGDAEELRARGMPLGLMPGMSYEEKDIVLDVGETALFYSDGLVEAHDPHGEMFGFPRLRALVAKHAEKNSLEETLLGELYSFVGEAWEQEDDITLVTLDRSEAS